MRIGIFRGYGTPKFKSRRKGLRAGGRRPKSSRRGRTGNLGKAKGWLGRPVVKRSCSSGQWKSKGFKTFMSCALDAVTDPNQ